MAGLLKRTLMKTNDEIYEALVAIRGDFQTHCATDALHFASIYQRLGAIDVLVQTSESARLEDKGRAKLLHTVGTFTIATIPTAAYALYKWLQGHH